MNQKTINVLGLDNDDIKELREGFEKKGVTLDDNQLITLAAIQTLRQVYSGAQKKWVLIEKKTI